MKICKRNAEKQYLTRTDLNAGDVFKWKGDVGNNRDKDFRIKTDSAWITINGMVCPISDMPADHPVIRYPDACFDPGDPE